MQNPHKKEIQAL